MPGGVQRTFYYYKSPFYYLLRSLLSMQSLPCLMRGSITVEVQHHDAMDPTEVTKILPVEKMVSAYS